MPSISELKWIIVWIWAIWLALVTLMNICEALMALKILPANFKFASSNWSLLLNVTAIYNTPRAVVAVLFAGAIVWEAAATLLLFGAGLGHSVPITDLGFSLMIALWGGFLLMSQFFRSFVVNPAIPEAHRSIYGVCLLSWVAMHVF